MLPMVVYAEVGVPLITGGLISAMSVPPIQGFLVALFRMSDTVSCCSVDVLLYDLIRSVLRSPVRSTRSCSSIPDEYKQLATVARKEWLVFYPWIPASLHIEATAFDNLFRPSGTQENQQVSDGFVKGVR